MKKTNKLISIKKEDETALIQLSVAAGMKGQVKPFIESLIDKAVKESLSNKVNEE